MESDATTDLARASQLEQWQEFLQSYSHGDLPANQTPRSPPLPPTIQGQAQSFNFGNSLQAPVCVQSEIDFETASKVREFYARHGFLPPPRGSGESARKQCVEDYDLYSADQVGTLIDIEPI
jgi:hypothetical protein